MNHEIFISYRRKNGFLMAQTIRDKLEEKGFSCFMDLSDLKAGAFDEKILAAIEQCRVFLLILPENGLRRCAGKNDWLRREILHAFSLHKMVLPVLLDGFSWPKRWDPRIPAPIRALSSINSIHASSEYFSAMIDKIISFFPADLQEAHMDSIVPAGVLPIEAGAFLSHAAAQFGRVEKVDLAFHGGDQWYRDPVKVILLEEFIQAGARIRVIVNTRDVLGGMLSGLGNPAVHYNGFEKNLEEWKSLEQKYGGQLQVRSSPFPLLHRFYRISGSENGAVNLRLYCYGNRNTRKDYCFTCSRNSPGYRLFCDEFEYLWNACLQTPASRDTED